MLSATFFLTEHYTQYLSSIKKKVGAESDWQMTNNDVYSNFAQTGDWMHDSAIDLGKVVDAGVTTMVYCGDAVSDLPPINMESPLTDGLFGSRTSS